MDAEGKRADVQLRLIVVGEQGVGKSALARRFVSNSFQEGPQCSDTEGLDVSVRYLELPDPTNISASTSILGNISSNSSSGKFAQETAKLQIMNAPGAVQFHALTLGYFKQVHGILVMYDVTNANPVEQVRRWLGDIDKVVNKKEVSVFLVGNKSDLLSPTGTVTSTFQEDLVRVYGLSCFEVSAKAGFGVESLFLRVALMIRQRQLASSLFKLDVIFNHDKDTGVREPKDKEKMGIGEKISSYFKGKFKRQRRRVKQKLLGAIGVADVTVDNLYSSEKSRYIEYDARIRVMQERIRSMFSSLSSSFQTGILLGDDFRWCSKRSGFGAGLVPARSTELVGSFSLMMAEGQRVCNSLFSELDPVVLTWSQSVPFSPPDSDITRAADISGTLSSASSASPAGVSQCVHIPHVVQQMEQRERALLDFDAYRRKLRNLMSAPQGDKKENVNIKLKKLEAKLLLTQENFEVLNSSMIQEFISCQDQVVTLLCLVDVTTLVAEMHNDRLAIFCSSLVLSCSPSVGLPASHKKFSLSFFLSVCLPVLTAV